MKNNSNGIEENNKRQQNIDKETDTAFLSQ